jgi:hypothetical protein
MPVVVVMESLLATSLVVFQVPYGLPALEAQVIQVEMPVGAGVAVQAVIMA